MKLALWYGFDAAIVLGTVTALLGAAAYLAWTRLHARLAAADRVLAAWPERAYDASLAGMLAFAGAVTARLQRGDLRFYLATVAGTAVVLGGWAFLTASFPRPLPGWPEAYAYEWLLAALTAAAAVAAVQVRSPMAAVAALGGVGFGVALLFLVLSAPDVAMTQFLVETLLVIIILLVLQRLPRGVHTGWGRPRPPAVRLRNAAIAAGAGALMAALLLSVTRVPFDARLSEFFAREAVPGGHGRNVVNVILVDFRALDTLGEIVVLAMAALGVLALLRVRPAPPPGGEVS